MDYVSLVQSSEETIALGKRLGRQLSPGTIVCLTGDLGAGKTTFIKGLASGLCDFNPDEVSSPTFVYLSIYEGKCPLYHFDLYRIRDVDEFLSMGFEEYLYSNGVCCIEWSERIESLLPREALFIHLQHMRGDIRQLSVRHYEKQYEL